MSLFSGKGTEYLKKCYYGLHCCQIRILYPGKQEPPLPLVIHLMFVVRSQILLLSGVIEYMIKTDTDF
jgi:hypothetical protein